MQNTALGQLASTVSLIQPAPSPETALILAFCLLVSSSKKPSRTVFPKPTPTHMSLTMRHCFAALKAIKRGIPLKKAVKKTIINAIGIKDLELARDVYDTVIEPMVLNAV